MEELNIKIQNLLDIKAAKQKIETYVETLNLSIEKAKSEIQNREQQFYAESADVEQLENSGLRNIFHHFLGQDDKALDHEKQEMLWAFMSLDKAKKAVELLQFEKSVLIQKLVTLDFDENEFQKLLTEKEALLIQYPKIRIKLTLFDHRMSELKKQTIEISEVIQIMDELMKLFEELYHDIKQITNWNQATAAYYGKGRYSSYKKKKFVEKNLSLIPRIVIANDKLNIELRDLKKKYDMDFTTNLTLLNHFFELFLDNLITDWVVRNGIISSLKTVENSRSKLDSLHLMLEHELSEIRTKMDDVEQQRKDLIISSGGF